MTVVQWLTVLGIPSLVSACVIGIVRYINKNRKHDEEIREQERQRNKALELGVQALLRTQMTNDYYKWTERRYAPIYAKDNFENAYKQYHTLGANGVMDGIYAEFMALPTTPDSLEE